MKYRIILSYNSSLLLIKLSVSLKHIQLCVQASRTRENNPSTSEMGNFRAYLIIRTIYISAIVSILKIMNSATVTASTSVCYHIKNVLFK